MQSSVCLSRLLPLLSVFQPRPPLSLSLPGLSGVSGPVAPSPSCWQPGSQPKWHKGTAGPGAVRGGHALRRASAAPNLSQTPAASGTEQGGRRRPPRARPLPAPTPLCNLNKTPPIPAAAHALRAAFTRRLCSFQLQATSAKTSGGGRERGGTWRGSSRVRPPCAPAARR